MFEWSESCPLPIPLTTAVKLITPEHLSVFIPEITATRKLQDEPLTYEQTITINKQKYVYQICLLSVTQETNKEVYTYKISHESYGYCMLILDFSTITAHDTLLTYQGSITLTTKNLLTRNLFKAAKPLIFKKIVTEPLHQIQTLVTKAAR